MEDKNNHAGLAAELRRQAEKKFLEKAPSQPENPAALPPDELKRVLHELRVHQIELEMQNEELRLAQHALDDQRARYFDLYDLAPVGYLTVSEKGLILQANLTAALMLGVERGALPKRPFSQFILKEDQDIFYLNRKQLFGNGLPQACEMRLVKKDGTAFWARLEANVSSESGEPACRIVLSDISARKKAEMEKETLAGVLAQKSLELEKFLYATAHDLRSPLVNIQGFNQQLTLYLAELVSAMPKSLTGKAQPLLSEKMPEALAFITSSALRMSQLLDALIRVARVGRQEVAAGRVDMDSLIKTVQRTFSFELDKIGGTVKIGPLPACSADAKSLMPVFANLIANSMKYRAPDRKLRINVSGQRKAGGTVVYTVSDNGRGIKPGDLENIWDLFYSGANRQGELEGEGIGLTVAKRIVLLNNGKLWARSEEGKGAEFFIELPGEGL